MKKFGYSFMTEIAVMSGGDGGMDYANGYFNITGHSKLKVKLNWQVNRLR